MPLTADIVQMPATQDIVQTSPTQDILQMIGGNKVFSGVNEGKQCLDRHEKVISDMVSPIYWFFFYDSGKQIVDDVRHGAQGFPLIQM
jgi:hypothetical protein